MLRWAIAVLVIVSAMAVNLRGARDVGRWSVLAAALVLGSFLLLTVVGLAHSSHPMRPIEIVVRDLASSHPSALLLGLSTIVFNFSGWDNVSPYAGEVEHPQRNYPLAIGGALVLAILVYLLPVLGSIAPATDPALWTADAGWPVIAGLIGGRGLGILLALTGLVSMWGLYSAQVLFISRIPYVLAQDGWFPAILGRTKPGTGVPALSVIGICVLTMPLAALSFPSLVVMQSIMYAGALTLEFLALLVLRARQPDAHRPFRVPAGRIGLTYVCIAPLTVIIGVLISAVRDADSFIPQLWAVAGMVSGGLIVYFLRRRTARQLRLATESKGNLGLSEAGA